MRTRLHPVLAVREYVRSTFGADIDAASFDRVAAAVGGEPADITLKCLADVQAIAVMIGFCVVFDRGTIRACLPGEWPPR